MRLSPARIRHLAAAVTHRLVNGSFIRYADAPESLTAKIEGTIDDEMKIEQRLDADVEKILESYRGEIDRGQVDYHQMFLMVKKKLAKERDFIF